MSAEAASGEPPYAAAGTLPAGTRPGAVRFIVADLERVQRFYEVALGLSAAPGADGVVALSAGGGEPLVELAADAAAPPRAPGGPGLFHLAMLLPDRRALALALRRLIGAGAPPGGASDHHVSESLYLTDPEGNGIEVTRDRTPEELARRPRPRSHTLALDVPGLLAELDGATVTPRLAPAGTRIGHVHLQVCEIGAADAFWQGVIGMHATVRGVPGAAFLAAGDYHHDLGLNSWETRGAPPLAPGSRGLSWFELRLPDAAVLGEVLDRVTAAGGGADGEPAGGGTLVRDPSGNRVRLRVG